MITLDVCQGIYRIVAEYEGHNFRWEFTRDNLNAACLSISQMAHARQTPLDWIVAALMIQLIRANIK